VATAVGTPATTPARAARRRAFGPIALTLPAAAGLLALFAAPFAVFVVYSFLEGAFFRVSGPASLDNYRLALESDFNRRLAQTSVITGFAAAAASVAIALPVAFWLRYASPRLRLVVLFLITASMLASYLVRIYAWRTILGENGMLNRGLEQIGLIDAPLGFLIFNRFAVVVALVHIFLPYVVLVLLAGFAPLTPAMLESAQDLGAGTGARWRRVVLPLIAAPATTAFLFVFVLAASDYVTPQFLGGTNGVMLGVEVRTQFTNLGDWPLGAATAILMLLAFVALWALTAAALRLMKLDRIRWAS
jgi:spermidine/putrescine transport system permease protein